VLPGGLRVVTEHVPGVRSAAFGVWAGVGSRDETPSLAGASHYLEHLLFKGTRRRSALDISAAMDAVGGELNAFTDKELTCFHARVRDVDLPLAVDVVADMVTSSVLAAGEVEAERGVILEEIAMHDDEPGDAVHDAFAETVWPSAPLGRPVLGSVASIEAMSRSRVASYYRRRYRPSELVVAVAGNVEHAKVLRLVREAFGAVLGGPDSPAPARRGGAGPSYRPSVSVLRRPTEQANLVLGGRGLACADDRRFPLSVLSAALGDGMSSRLFQEVREKRGLAYAVYSFTAGYADAGLFGVYAGCRPRHAREVLGVCREQLADVAASGLTLDEVQRAKGQLAGSFVLGLEDTGARMSRLGRAELSHGEWLDPGDVLAAIDAVDVDAVREVAAEVLGGPYGLAVIGPDEGTDYAELVA
jgi:predicted Zn-dependent peptidase